MTKGFPCLTVGLLVVLAFQETHGEPASSLSEKVLATTQSPNIVTKQSNQSNIVNVKPTNQSQPLTSLDNAQSTIEKTESVGPTTLRRRYIVDTSDVDMNHDDCISGDAEIGEFTKRVASALQGYMNSHWRAVGISKRADVNGDGKICWCDFIAIYLKDKILGLNHEFPFVVVPDDVMFAQMDVNKDGKLEGKERSDLQAQFASCMTPKQARSIIDAMSIMKDLDESISIQEYRTFFSQPFMPLRLEQRAKYMSLQRRQYLHKQHNNQQQPQQQLRTLQEQQQPQHHESQWQEELRRLQQTGNDAKPPQSHLVQEAFPSLTKQPSGTPVQPRPPPPQQYQNLLRPKQDQEQLQHKQQQGHQQEPRQKQQELLQQQQQQHLTRQPPQLQKKYPQRQFQQQQQQLKLQQQQQQQQQQLQQEYRQPKPQQNGFQQQRYQPHPPTPLQQQPQPSRLQQQQQKQGPQPPRLQQQQQPSPPLQQIQQQQQKQQHQLVEDLQHAPVYYQLLYRQQLNKMAPLPPYFIQKQSPQRPLEAIHEQFPHALQKTIPKPSPVSDPSEQAQPPAYEPQQQRLQSKMPSKPATENSEPVEHQNS